MSSIVGICYRDGRKVKPEQIKKMNNRLSHRGPDRSAVWFNGSVALGHQMLWTTPESLNEKLPFFDEKTGLVITADARIDNRKDLSDKLDIDDIVNVSDSYFILKSYEKWGEECPEHLLGDFAFAIWDENEEKLFCARDHMGIKPFYYYMNDDIFVFATEIKALFTISEIVIKLNRLKAAFYLIGIDDNKSTFYENILRLIPAHFIKLDQNKCTFRKYWELDSNLQVVMDSDEDYINTFRQIFAEAVNCRLRTAFPIGFELSGGLDSSSITCMAKKLITRNKTINSNKINTFSYILKDFPQSDESYFINKVVEAGGINPKFIQVDKLSFLKNMNTILWYQDQPFISAFMTYLWCLCKKAQENNIRILFSGNGGDQVISFGTNYFKELAVGLNWIKLVREINSYSNIVNKSFYSILLEKVLFKLVPDYVKQIIKPKTEKRLNFLNDKFVKDLHVDLYLKDLYLDPFNDANTPKKFHYYLINNPLNIHILEMFDNTTNASSIVPVYPFLDKRLIEFCYSIPTDMKFKFGRSRYILRAAMEGILPEKNQWRPFKGNYSTIYQKNLISLDNNCLNKIICNNDDILKDFADLNNLQEVYKNLNHGILNSDSSYLWYALLFSIWLKNSNINKIQ
jgi:asparagine synthase (glutamine-hydrolysing)